jgi:fatty acid desaturase
VLDKIDVRKIIAGHVETFRDYATKERSRSDLILFLGTPLVVMAAALWWHFDFSVSVVNSLLSAFSIFAGLLFNLLVMVLSFLQAGRGNNSERQLSIRREVLRQITANLSFSILTSLAIIILAIVALALVPKGEDYIPRWGTAVILVGSVNFGLTLLMVLKRMYDLMINEVERSREMDRVA